MSEVTKSSTFDVDIKFEDGGDQLLKTARRITGLVRIKYIGKLINALDLDANPRNSKVGPVTNAILETLEMSPELYPIKSKGILLGSSQFESLDVQGRFGLTFENRQLEGVLDGGHNLLAIGIYLLEKALEDPKDKKELAKAKSWNDFKDIHSKHLLTFEKYLSSGDEALQHKVWVELIVPPSEDAVAVERFEGVLLEIQEARNNNVQLKGYTKTNQAGYFEELKRFIDKDIAEKIEWKENDGGKIKVADLVALTWIPLMSLEIAPEDEDGKAIAPPSPVALYAQKATCVNRFDDFMACPGITSRSGAQVSLDSVPVRSALKLASEMPRIYDFISGHLPASYNKSGARYGRIQAVANLNKTSRQATSKFTEQLIDKKSPEGFIIPLVYAMRALIRKNDDGTLEWSMDPYAFLSNHLDPIVDNLRDFILNPEDETSGDPQKIGKNASIYKSCLQAAQLEVMAAKGALLY